MRGSSGTGVGSSPPRMDVQCESWWTTAIGQAAEGGERVGRMELFAGAILPIRTHIRIVM